MIFKENNKAIYLQIADKICDDILAGALKCGERILSVRDYAASVEVNANTVMRSYEHLSRLGIIYNRRGIGFFISDDGLDIVRKMKKEELFNGDMPHFFRQMMLIGIDSDELKSMYETFLATDSKNNPSK